MVPRSRRRARHWSIILLLASLGCRSNGIRKELDADNDGFTADNDCDDANPLINTAALEACNGFDDDCDGQIDEADDVLLGSITIYLDADGDGYGVGQGITVCNSLTGYAQQAGDCDDDDPDIFPLADELCNGLDDDCDNDIDENPPDGDFWFPDSDGDGYGSVIGAVRACEEPQGYVSNGDDCNDDDSDHNPTTAEVCDSLDNDCDGLIDDEDPNLQSTLIWYRDGDGDGFGVSTDTIMACEPPSGYTDQLEDCDDTTGTVSPGILYDGCDGKDNDCDSHIDEDVKAGWQLFTADTNGDVVWDIAMHTGDMSMQSTIQDPNIRLNSMDVSENGTSVVHDHLNDQLHYMDACTGVTALIGDHNVGNNCGIVFGPSGKLYGLDTNNDSLVEFDLFSGQGSIIGSLGTNIGNCGLAYDCANDRLVGADGASNRIFTIDPVTGTAYDFVQTTVPFQSVGLEFVPSEQLLYAATGSQLYTIDPVSGSSNYVGPLGLGHVDDLALHPSCP